MPGKTIKKFWKFPSGGIGNGQFDSGGIGNGQFEPDSFVVSGQSQIHGDSNIWISTTSSEVSATVNRLRDSFMGKNLHILLDSRSR